MITGDSVGIACCHACIFCIACRTVKISAFGYYKCAQLPSQVLPKKHGKYQIMSTALETQTAEYCQLVFCFFFHFRNGTLMKKMKLASFTVNAVKCLFSVGATQ